MRSHSGAGIQAETITLPRLACLVLVVLFALAQTLLSSGAFMLSGGDAQWSDVMFYPFSILYLLLPSPLSAICWLSLHVLIGGMGAFLLMERWTHNRALAATTALVFASFLFRTHWTTPIGIAALAWLPWILRLAECAWSQGRSALLFCAVVTAMQLLAGSIEVVVLTFTSLAVLALGTMTPRCPEARLMLKRTSDLGVITLLFVATQIVPLADLGPRIHLEREADRIKPGRSDRLAGSVFLVHQSFPIRELQPLARN